MNMSCGIASRRHTGNIGIAFPRLLIIIVDLIIVKKYRIMGSNFPIISMIYFRKIPIPMIELECFKMMVFQTSFN